MTPVSPPMRKMAKKPSTNTSGVASRSRPPHSVAIQQNTVLEERVARDKDEALRALETLRQEVDAIIHSEGGRRGARVARAVEERFANARFPFLGDRAIPRIAVQSTAGEVSLETGLRNPTPWTEEAKRSLIRRGYELLDDLLVEEAVA